MAPLPKKKISKARRGTRNAAKNYSLPKVGICPNCGKPKLAHVVCPSCGFYKGKLIIQQKEKPKVTKVEKDER